MLIFSFASSTAYAGRKECLEQCEKTYDKDMDEADFTFAKTRGACPALRAPWAVVSCQIAALAAYAASVKFILDHYWACIEYCPKE